MRNYQQRAIVSLDNKNDAVPFLRGLHDRGFKMFSTGGTAKLIRDNQMPVTDIPDYTGFPEGMDGRLKTLHPKVHGGLLGLLNNPSHVAFQDAQGITPFQLLIVNFYDFARAVSEGGTHAQIIERIDIGGPAMIRAAGKNYPFCLPVIDLHDYKGVLAQLDAHGTKFEEHYREVMQWKAFRATADYDNGVANYLKKKYHIS